MITPQTVDDGLLAVRKRPGGCPEEPTSRHSYLLRRHHHPPRGG
ncbi:hypothetical protein HMPREF9056_02978 [Actinomyces sp. oral taxon 170 str. F0386]|nr:hypothetical protein HMPREF9056_02978 [Actinomyces sp. oral taxon 170 str. F0386]